MTFLRQNYIAIAAVLLVLTGCSRQEPTSRRASDPGIPVTLAEVVVTNLDRTIPVVGTLYAKDEANLAAEVEGRVERTMAEFGDRLTNGQLIAQIDTMTYDALARQAAANLARLKASSANTEQNLRRVRELAKKEIASTSDLDQAVAAAEQARSEVSAAEAAEAIARLNLERSRVRAPYDSAVAERIANMGDFVKAGSPLFRVVNDGLLKYIVQAPERYAGDVHKEQLVRFTVDAYSEPFEGKVYLISPSVNTTTRGFAFGALVENRGGKLKANTFARGELILDRNASALMVPLDAIISFAGVTKVFVVENGTARGRTVQAGRVLQERQEILSGLKPGEKVVVSGQTKLFDGARVRIKSSDDGKAI